MNTDARVSNASCSMVEFISCIAFHQRTIPAANATNEIATGATSKMSSTELHSMKASKSPTTETTTKNARGTATTATRKIINSNVVTTTSVFAPLKPTTKAKTTTTAETTKATETTGSIAPAASAALEKSSTYHKVYHPFLCHFVWLATVACLVCKWKIGISFWYCIDCKSHFWYYCTFRIFCLRRYLNWSCYLMEEIYAIKAFCRPHLNKKSRYLNMDLRSSVMAARNVSSSLPAETPNVEQVYSFRVVSLSGVFASGWVSGRARAGFVPKFVKNFQADFGLAYKTFK